MAKPIPVEDLKAGDVLYDCHRHKAGNTTMSVDGVWEVYVSEVGSDERGPWARLAWNGNAPRGKTYRTTDYARWPKEWPQQDLFGEAECYLCNGKKSKGHRPDCKHPGAIRARKRVAKEAKAAS
jgi:hypothetical protein